LQGGGGKKDGLASCERQGKKGGKKKKKKKEKAPSLRTKTEGDWLLHEGAEENVENKE